MDAVEEMVDLITEALYVYDEGEGEMISSINTYKDEGLLTNDDGLVVRLKDQKLVFHITVVERES